MTQPKVTITELDGALGVLPASAGRIPAVVGVSSTGVANTPATFARVTDLVSTFGAGPLVEAAAAFIELYGLAVCVVKTEHTGVAGTASAVTSVATGTSVVTVTAVPAPLDDYELVLLVVTGGTIGVAGATYRVSYDGGRTYGAETALGVATSAALGTSGVSLDFAAGTLVAGDTHSVVTTAPQWDGTELTTALTALKNTLINWELAFIVGPIDATTIDNVETAFAGMFSAGKYHGYIAHVRMPTPGETEAAYLSAMTALSAAKSTKYGSVDAGACKLTSSVNGRKYRRPAAFSTAPRTASVSEEVNIADLTLGALPGVSIRDANGNPDEHDESFFPGLDDLRYEVLRTHDGYSGVYVNRPRLFSPEGSDFQLMPHRRVLNLVHDALRTFFTLRLNKPVLVDRATGFILESEALEIESGARAVMRSVLLAKPKASGIQFTLSRTDNLLSTKTMTGQARVIPLAYPEFINLDIGFINPALQVEAV